MARLKRGAVIRWATARGLCLSGKVVCVAKAGQTVCQALKRELDWTKVKTHGAVDFDRYVVRVRYEGKWQFYALKVDGIEVRHAWAKPDWERGCSRWLGGTACGARPIAPETGWCGPCTFGDETAVDGKWAEAR